MWKEKGLRKCRDRDRGVGIMLFFLWVFLLLGICAESMRMSLSRVPVSILSRILWKYCAQMIVVVTLSLLKASIHSKYKSLSYSPPSLRTRNSFIAQIKFCLSSSLRILGFLILAPIKKNPAFFKNLKAAIKNFSFFQCFDPHECLKPVFLDSLLSDKSKSEQTHLLFICNPRHQNNFSS